jgi:Mg2+ and Co2+ transporter CorA
MLRLFLATFAMEEIEEKLLKSQNQKLGQNATENQEKEKHGSTMKEVIQSKSTVILMQIKSLQGMETTQISFTLCMILGDL